MNPDQIISNTKVWWVETYPLQSERVVLSFLTIMLLVKTSNQAINLVFHQMHTIREGSPLIPTVMTHK